MSVVGALSVVASCGAPPARVPDVPRADGPVRVWEDTLTIPTWEEGPPDPNAPFEVFGQKRAVYPYTMRRNFGDRAVPRAWRALHLENVWLHCVVLPDLGGHLYGCTDKRNGAEMFYANKSIKLANVAYRGAWAALGIEFNFPVSHSWTTVSPVDFATSTGADGSASVWIGNVDRVGGMAWRVELVMRPGRAVLEQHTTLENPSDARHRFYWWTNAAVRAWDDTQIVFPTEHTASHGFTEVDTWPTSTVGEYRGVDLHVVGNHTKGPVSLFAHASREPYMAVLQPRTRTGVAHVSSPSDLPSKKFYSWGVDGDARAWNKTLSDDDSNYVEIQAGLFKNQETYAFFEPGEARHFTEHWLPLKDLPAVTRITTDAAIHLARTAPAPDGSFALDLAIAPMRSFEGTVRLLRGGTVVAEARASLSPAKTFAHRFAGLRDATYTVEVRDGAGAMIVTHTEGRYDVTPKAEVKVGPQVAPAEEEPWTALELDGKSIEAFAKISREIAHRRVVEATNPAPIGLLRAGGRLAYTTKQFPLAATFLAEVVRRDPTDREARYYLGVAHVARKKLDEAKVVLEPLAQSAGPYRAAALEALAGIAGRAGDFDRARAAISSIIAEQPNTTSRGWIEVALLRRAGAVDDARKRLDVWRRRDPTSSALRYEATRLGVQDEALWRHLAGDPERIIALAGDRMRFGLWADARELLARPYPTDGVVSEPGTLRPEAHPLVAYYRAACREALGEDAREDFAAGARSTTELVFPNRADSIPVLERAIAKNPRDATAHMLLGALRLSAGAPRLAMASWDEVISLEPRRRGAHRNLAMTLLREEAYARAERVFEEGVLVDPDNLEIWLGLDETLVKLGKSAADRLASIDRHPKRSDLPAPLLLHRALLLAAIGRFDEAERSLAGKTFAREERGVDVRGVYLQVRVARAEARVKASDCAGARAIVDHLLDAVPGMTFTDGALAAYAKADTIRPRIEAITKTCQ